MDSKKRERIIADLKKPSTGTDKDIVKVIEEIVDHPERLYDIDDSFCFDNSKCMNDCNGHCCTSIDMVRVSPVDVDVMMKSKILAGEQRRKVVDFYLETFLGRMSRLPMAIIRFMILGPLKFCPFMTFLARKKSDFENVLEPGKIEEVNPLLVLFEKMNDIRGVCMLGQTRKPAICMLYPLGRMVMAKEKNTDEKNWIFLGQVCEGTNTSKKIKIRDYVKPYIISSKKNYAYQEDMLKVTKKLKDELKNDKIVDAVLEGFKKFLFYDDGKTSDKMKTILAVIDGIISKIREGRLEEEKSEYLALELSRKNFKIIPRSS